MSGLGMFWLVMADEGGVFSAVLGLIGHFRQ